MSKAPHNEHLRLSLAEELNHARSLTDALFQLVRTEAMTDRPVPERHRIIFYQGHLEAFDWNMIGRQAFGLNGLDAEFDRLFAFGIDPVDGHLPDDPPDAWPSISEIQKYLAASRSAVDDCLNRANLMSSDPFLNDGFMFRVGIEHRLMHAETLAYLLHWLDYERKVASPFSVPDLSPAPEPRRVDIPAGHATLGFTGDLQAPFGWDNEFQSQVVPVPAFSMDAFDVTNGQFLEFMKAGAYEDRSFWDADSWKWIQSEGIRHPKFWTRSGGRWRIRTMFAEAPLPLAWPVYVSHAEAAAYARWAGRSLPTEAQFHRAAFGAPHDAERLYPWGSAPPACERGNFNFRNWNPAPIGSYPAGDSAFGISDLVGNGWEWTSSVFEPFPGFKPFPFYPGYSANFFDGRHYVLKGASSRTAATFLRRSFRNWFQPHYANIYATFRCVDN